VRRQSVILKLQMLTINEAFIKKRRENTGSVSSSKALIRAGATRDSALRSVRNLNSLAEQAKLNVDDGQKLVARIHYLDQYVDQFE